MLTRTLFAMTLAAALFATGCAKKEEPKEEPKVEAPAIDLAAEEQAIRNRSGEWMNYANSKDAASIASGDLCARCGHGFRRQGLQGIGCDPGRLGSANQEDAGRGRQLDVGPGPRRQFGDLAVETGSFTVDPDGEGKKEAIQGSFATAWAKIDGQWRAISDAGGQNAAAATP